LTPKERNSGRGGVSYGMGGLAQLCRNMGVVKEKRKLEVRPVMEKKRREEVEVKE